VTDQRLKLQQQQQQQQQKNSYFKL